ncbi:hypothetical protein [Streptomyces niveus]|uniref:hypothetical protein n=1 Tax=Streptomyces niveus TaxID=193462 RepID=UPI000AE9EAB5|nr:hypothetical protein [Streptomyces niveus]
MLEDSKRLEFLDALDDPSIKWHAVQSMDFGVLDKILNEGLPASHQSEDGNWWQVCVSRSPGSTAKDGELYNSFLRYTMEPARFAVAIRTDKSHRPEQWFFQDEQITTQRTPPADIVAVVANDRTLASPLSAAEVDGLQINSGNREYFEGNLEWMHKVCGEVIAKEFREKWAGAGVGNDRIQRLMLREIGSHIRTSDRGSSTVADAIKDCIVRAGSSATLFSWDDQTKQALESITEQLRAGQAITLPLKDLVQNWRSQQAIAAAARLLTPTSNVSNQAATSSGSSVQSWRPQQAIAAVARRLRPQSGRKAL